jgi:hypothetical protein
MMWGKRQENKTQDKQDENTKKTLSQRVIQRNEG